MVKKVITESEFKNMSWKLHQFDQKKIWLRIRRYEHMCDLMNQLEMIRVMEKRILPYKR